ncbi:pilus assembly protein [Thermobifida halotolerans]|uniref:Pilus assembly protein n=1 Tax=Thermobifida halotolerans TaxID=483545 RepID=A0A399G4M1_9ACTN|nr:TadE/TadG family type IV pilus assembly protein [Thermobifida halotolerans]UOE17999.1 pilus assembly protein [Thermobifida halotolerans]
MPRSPSRSGRRRPGRRDDRGSQILEFAVYFPLFLLMAAVAFEVFLAFVAVEHAENAARVGARTVQRDGPLGAVGVIRDALPDWLDDAQVRAGVTADRTAYAEVEIALPLFFEVADLDYTVVRRVDMAA